MSDSIKVLFVCIHNAARSRMAEELLRSRGGVAVFLGRWVAFFRAVMPALAGTVKMPYRTFLPWNALGGFVWGTTFVLVGYFAGASYKKIETYVGRGAAIAVAAVVIASRAVKQPAKREPRLFTVP